MTRLPSGTQRLVHQCVCEAIGSDVHIDQPLASQVVSARVDALRARLRELFQAPEAIKRITGDCTVRAIARLVADEAGPVLRTTLTRLPGSRGKFGVLFTHPVSGTVAFYALAAQYLHSYACWVAQSPKLSEQSADAISAQQIAAHNIELLGATDFWPGGVIGYSFGCLVALEMYRELESSGRCLPPLVLVAPPLSIFLTPGSAPVIRKPISNRHASLLTEALFQREDTHPPADVAAKIANSYIQNFAASATYDVNPIQSDIAIVLPVEDNTDRNELIREKSPVLSRGRIRQYSAPGTHATVFQEPSVRELCSTISAVWPRAAQ